MNNPPAFPHSHTVYSKGQPSYEDSDYADGMTLRDYFAAKAMQGLLAEGWSENVSLYEVSYRHADGMLEEREKRI